MQNQSASTGGDAQWDETANLHCFLWSEGRLAMVECLVICLLLCCETTNSKLKDLIWATWASCLIAIQLCFSSMHAKGSAIDYSLVSPAPESVIFVMPKLEAQEYVCKHSYSAHPGNISSWGLVVYKSECNMEISSAWFFPHSGWWPSCLACCSRPESIGCTAWSDAYMASWNWTATGWICSSGLLATMRGLHTCCINDHILMYETCSKVMLVCRLKWFGGSTIEESLGKAFEHFTMWKKQQASSVLKPHMP